MLSADIDELLLASKQVLETLVKVLSEHVIAELSEAFATILQSETSVDEAYIIELFDAVNALLHVDIVPFLKLISALSKASMAMLSGK